VYFLTFWAYHILKAGFKLLRKEENLDYCQDDLIKSKIGKGAYMDEDKQVLTMLN